MYAQRLFLGQPTAGASFSGTPVSGQIVKTGSVPTLVHSFVGTPASGSIVKTGSVPILSRNFIGVPVFGQIVKTGQVPILSISGGVTASKMTHSWFVKAIGIKTKIVTQSQVNSDTGDTP